MTNAEAWFSIALRSRKPEGSLGRKAQDGHLDSHTAPELGKDVRRAGRELEEGVRMGGGVRDSRVVTTATGWERIKDHNPWMNEDNQSERRKKQRGGRK